jgi:hypothetical protein
MSLFIELLKRGVTLGTNVFLRAHPNVALFGRRRVDEGSSPTSTDEVVLSVPHARLDWKVIALHAPGARSPRPMSAETPTMIQGQSINTHMSRSGPSSGSSSVQSSAWSYPSGQMPSTSPMSSMEAHSTSSLARSRSARSSARVPQKRAMCR